MDLEDVAAADGRDEERPASAAQTVLEKHGELRVAVGDVGGGSSTSCAGDETRDHAPQDEQTGIDRRGLGEVGYGGPVRLLLGAGAAVVPRNGRILFSLYQWRSSVLENAATMTGKKYWTRSPPFLSPVTLKNSIIQCTLFWAEVEEFAGGLGEFGAGGAGRCEAAPLEYTAGKPKAVAATVYLHFDAQADSAIGARSVSDSQHRYP